MDQMEHNFLINIKDLTRGYPENPYLLFNKFNLALYKNDFLVIMGKSGTGKSTLAKLLIGELKTPQKTIYHKNEDISKYGDDELQLYRRKIGMVFQDYKLMDELTVRENVIYPLKIYGLGDSIIANKFDAMKAKLGLQKLVNTPIKFLSAGEKQKVCIARALIHEPEFVIADEPTGNLDREHTQQIADLLIQTNVLGNTVVLITHDIHLLNYLKDKVWSTPTTEKHKIKLHVMA
jgi:cell division transport system ATP-binding protein